MLENRKNVRKFRNILIALMVIVMTISLCTKVEAATIQTIDIDNGTINPIYRPEWTKMGSTLDTTNKTLTVTLKGSAYKVQTINENVTINYLSDVTSSLDKEDITVFINGTEVTSTTNPTVVVNEGVISTNATSGKKEVTHTIVLSNLEEATRKAGIPFKEWSGNIALKIGGRGEDSSTYDAGVLTDSYGNDNMMETDQGQADGTWIDVTFKDADVTANANGTMFMDYIKPEFTYESSKTTIGDGNHGDTKLVTIVFDVIDKYFSSTDLATDTAASLITVKVDDENVNSAITKQLSKVEDINYTVNGATRKIGERYQLVVSNLEKLDGYTYSGPMTISFGSGIVTDLSNNSNDATTITVGVDETDGNANTTPPINGDIVDVVDPIWKAQNVTTTTTGGITTSTMDLIATDKYFKQATLTKEQVQVIVEGVNIAGNDASGNPIAPELETNLSAPQYIKWDRTTETYVTATEAEANGVKYTYTVSKLEESDSAFFAERAKYATNNTTGRVFREYSGPTKIVIPADTIEDNSGNKNLPITINIGTIDTLKPEVIKVSSQSNINATNVELSTHTIVFDIVDKYMNTSAITTTDTSKIHVFLDNEEATSITKTITNIQELRATAGTQVNQLVGYRYTLQLSGFEKARTAINYTREFTDWSGSLSIKIDAGTATDSKGNSNVLTELKGNENSTTKPFVDYIKPDVTYQYTESSQAVPGDINYDGKTFKMVFDITDKHYANSTLTINDLTILIDNQAPDWTKVSKNLTSTDITNSVNGATKTIGKRYTLTLSSLEQLQVAVGAQYLDYSGVITVAIPQGKVTDNGPAGNGTNPNGNDATTITSGIDIPGGAVGDSVIVDVVDPLIEKTSSSALAVEGESEAILDIRVTDKYISDSTITESDIKVFLNGTETATGFTLDVSDPEPIYKTGTTDVQVGANYTITITGFDEEINQLKIQIPENAVTDASGNGNKVTTFIVYNPLRSAEGESSQTSVFLGGTIQRQNIENVTFQTLTHDEMKTWSEAIATDTSYWDVSALGDKSIVAHYVDSDNNGAYEVTIGSDFEIFANRKSSYLFSYVGYSESCEAEQTLTNLNLLNVNSVDNMGYMFNRTGYRAMTSLTLPTTFDTSNVTWMLGMFYGTGYSKMESLVLPNSFDTSKVTSMYMMFMYTGARKLKSLTLPTSFNTENVTIMSSMFEFTGSSEMESLELPESFDTSSVTSMSRMFLRNWGD